ncbi:NosD domain-containing protein, partial [Sneathiella sp.]|uniref:NosD domain-containing protein n=1 Tax=Sneathiella sp. TaxID=1964365 RepID=UPI0026339FA8
GVGLPDLDFDAIFTNNIFEDGSALAYVGDTNVARSQEITYQGELVDYTVITRSITESLDVAQAGDTVLVGAGTYDSLRIDYDDPENITIDGQGVATISLDGTESLQRIVDLRADGTTFTGFNIDGGGTHVGISISGQNVTASENNIQNVLTGIQTTTQYTAGNNTITGNTITESGYGISLQNNSNVVTNNIIDVETEGMGIGSGDNTIAGNTFTVGSEGVHIQTYTTEDYDALPGADIDLLAALDDNNFSSATYVTDGTDITVQTIFGNIQSAIDVASSGNTVEIMEGVYEEDVVDTKKLAFAFSNAVLDGLTLNTDGSSISGTASSSVNGFTFNVDVVLDGNTSLTTTGDAGITTAAIDGASAGGQTLNISSSGPASIGSVGKTTRLGATDIGGTGAKTLTGDTYKADSLNVDGPVTLTQSLTSFNTTQSATAAGDITFTGDLFGTTSGEQNIVLIAGDGEGEASTNGDISLQSAGTETVKLGQMEVLGNDFSAATVYLADSFDAQQTGDQTFTQETLNADGNVTSTVGGNVNGPINSGGTATVSAGKSVVGSVTGAVVDVKAVTTVSGTVSGTTSVKVSANNIDATVTSQGTAEIDAVDSYNGTVTAAKSTINATVVDAVVNGGSSTIVANSGNVTGNANVDVEGGGALDVNGRKVIGSSEADFYQMVVEDYVLPEGAIVTTSGEIVLPKGLALGLISPPSDGSIEPKVILVRDVRALGSLLEQGYTAIVIDLNGTSDVDEETQLVMAE